MTSDPVTVPAIVWTMKHPDGDEHRFMLAGDTYIMCYPAKKKGTWSWFYTVLSVSTEALMRDFAIGEVARYEQSDWTLDKEPRCHRDLVYTEWLGQQHGMTAETSMTLDDVFMTIIRFGEQAA